MNVKQLVRQNAVQLLEIATDPKDRERAEGFVKRWQRGEKWPPLQVHANGYVINGQRRLLAAFLMNHQSIDVELV
jgi:hypothetical protein